MSFELVDSENGAKLFPENELSVERSLCANCRAEIHCLEGEGKTLIKDLDVLELKEGSISTHPDEMEEDVSAVRALSSVFIPPLWDEAGETIRTKLCPWTEDELSSLVFCSRCLRIISSMYIWFKELCNASNGQSFVLERFKSFLMKRYYKSSSHSPRNRGKRTRRPRARPLDDEYEADHVGLALMHERRDAESEDGDHLLVPKQELFEEQENNEVDGYLGFHNGADDAGINAEMKCDKESSKSRASSYSRFYEDIPVDDGDPDYQPAQPSAEERQKLKRLSRSVKRVSSKRDAVRKCPVCPKKFRRTQEVFRHFKSTHDVFRKNKRVKQDVEEIEEEECESYGDTEYFNQDESELMTEREEESEKTEKKTVLLEEEEARRGRIAEFVEVIDDSDLTNVRCQHCQEVFERRYAFSHISNHHRDMIDIPYPCNLCHHLFLTKPAFEIHQEYHTGSSGFCCEECGKPFTTSDKLKRHIKNVHEAKKIVCKECGAIFSSHYQLNNHNVKVHNMPRTNVENEKKRHVCSFPGCGKSFDRRYRRDAHEDCIHRGIKPHQCPQCPRAFSRRDKLNAHYRTKHDIDGMPVSPTEKKIEPSRKQKKQSIDSPSKDVAKLSAEEEAEKARVIAELTTPVYSDERVPGQYEGNSYSTSVFHKCNLCNCTSSIKSILYHLLQNHNDQCKLSILCELCGKGFVTREALRHHKKRHLSTRRFVCEECNKPFKAKRSLEHHFSSVHKNEKFMCSYCGKGFSREYVLKRHEKSHKGLEPVLSTFYYCPYEDCKKVFSKVRVYQEHLDAHEGLKNYKCHICSKSFGVIRNLQAHVRSVHEGRKRVPRTKIKVNRETTAPPPQPEDIYKDPEIKPSELIEQEQKFVMAEARPIHKDMTVPNVSFLPPDVNPMCNPHLEYAQANYLFPQSRNPFVS